MSKRKAEVEVAGDAKRARLDLFYKRSLALDIVRTHWRREVDFAQEKSEKLARIAEEVFPDLNYSLCVERERLADWCVKSDEAGDAWKAYINLENEAHALFMLWMNCDEERVIEELK